MSMKRILPLPNNHYLEPLYEIYFMRYIIDTHALIWYFTGDKRLSQKVKAIIQAAERGDGEVVVPVIVLLEAIDIQEKKKIIFDITDLFDFIDSKDNFQVAGLNFEHIRAIVGIGKGLDLHDRVVVMIGQMFGGIILTKDSQIKKFAKAIW